MMKKRQFSLLSIGVAQFSCYTCAIDSPSNWSKLVLILRPALYKNSIITYSVHTESPFVCNKLLTIGKVYKVMVMANDAPSVVCRWSAHYLLYRYIQHSVTFQQNGWYYKLTHLNNSPNSNWQQTVTAIVLLMRYSIFTATYTFLINFTKNNFNTNPECVL